MQDCVKKLECYAKDLDIDISEDLNRDNNAEKLEGEEIDQIYRKTITKQAGQKQTTQE